MNICDNVTFGDNVRADATTLDVSLTLEPPGFSLNQDGTINIPANCIPGSYSYIYSFCPTGSTTGCVNDIQLQVVVTTTIKANGDVFYFDIYGNKVPNTSSVYRIFDNDRIYPECILESNIIIAGQVNATLSSIDTSQFNNKFTISASGVINPTNGVVTPPSNNTIPEGTYPFSYTICDNRPGYTTICSTAYGWIGVIGYVNNRINNSINDGSNTLKSFIVSPNPSDGIFTIDFASEITDTAIEVYSILGQKLFSEIIFNNNSIDVDLQKFSSGTYILKITDKEKSITKLIIKK